MITFIIGGVKSGKTSFALKKAENKGNKNCYYIATARAIDEEMKERIERHKRERGSHWTTIEEPIKIGEIINKLPEKSILVVDCLNTWITNLLVEGFEYEDFVESFINSVLKNREKIEIFIVANEVGLGIVPENELSRRFIDIAGTLNQRIMNICDKAYFMIAGIPLEIK
ncbi:MAG: bifunctional adenosylcobinamide kinase/adenosylcobinamide-phosphate guanylyltransferase [Thermodesulfovibrio sp.]|nr:bifunctional adenosylcobinamide kinase/adenosylcobinamide-phosphate guanylyltransferase [Thermodesulfovibrio sp.]MCX7723899.1 bifunctional adenosylcobinamide kinase/adenosylcobinamide-phosphate guanylyltransferase [Thermodesulfovibrio sp.]MDW7971941.1 bifunctional adenosylcobinamide kinase/adenosylcobinamide-phosphate guanylyltransferase [Thermodesulfovibrio sp.]